MPLKPRDPDCNDCKVIECAWCGECLNGRSIWILHDTHEVFCEECVILYKLKRPLDAN